MYVFFSDLGHSYKIGCEKMLACIVATLQKARNQAKITLYIFIFRGLKSKSFALKGYTEKGLLSFKLVHFTEVKSCLQFYAFFFSCKPL